MLSKPDRYWLFLLLGLISSWSLGCEAPPAESINQQAAVSKSESGSETKQSTQAPEKSTPVESQLEQNSTEATELADTAEVSKPDSLQPSSSESTEPEEAAPEETSELPEQPIAKPEQESPEEDPPEEEIYEDEFVEPEPLPAPEGLTAMPAPNRVWIDDKNKSVVVDGYISLQEGMLEMFACPIGTKEHESIVAVYSSAQVVHAALLVVGAEVGSPVQFNPEFKPATGTEITIEVRWLDDEKKWQSIEAQQLITDIKTNKPMDHPWVFAGSGFFKDEETGEEFYMAEGGELVCVSNFSTATLDIPAESSQVNDGLLFSANGEKVPPLWTPVRLVLTPKLDKPKSE